MPSLYHRMQHTSEKPGVKKSCRYGAAPGVGQFLLFEMPSASTPSVLRAEGSWETQVLAEAAGAPAFRGHSFPQSTLHGD